MSGRELDRDGTDSYHPRHPWEQTTHPLYIAPKERTLFNWPPEPASPAGPHEAMVWRSLPVRVKPDKPDMFGPGHSFPAPLPTSTHLLCLLGVHRWDYYGNAHTHAPRPVRCERCGVEMGTRR